MATTQKLLGEAVGIQFTGTRDETGTNPILGLTDGLIVGQFRRGRTDKPMRITQQNIRAELGYEPNNKFYQSVQNTLDYFPHVDVLRVGEVGGSGGGGGGNGGGNEIPSDEMHFTTLAGSVDYVGTQGDQILLSNNSIVDITATNQTFTFNAPAGKHKVKLVESVGRNNYVSVGGEALVELHNFPTLSTVTKFNFTTREYNSLPNLTKVPNVFPSNITNMEGMFYLATNFNQDISMWDVSNVTNMGGMFRGATSFNQPLDNWDVSNVTKLNIVFADASSFNQPLNNWDVSSVTSIWYMFMGATSFNQPLDNWDVSNVTNIGGMFNNMNGMFNNASAFNQDLSMWCVSNIPTVPSEFDLGATNWTLPRPVWGTCPAP